MDDFTCRFKSYDNSPRYNCVNFKWKLTSPGYCSDNSFANENKPVFKPVIYLYPEQTQTVNVQLDYQGELIADYPAYDQEMKGREVIASPEGTLINKADGKEYSYLFWEGKPRETPNYDLSEGFLVKGSETRAFLQEKLAEI